MSNNAYIVSAVRTAWGKKNGRLSAWHPADLGAKVLDELVYRSGIKPELIDDVIFGCVDQVGAQSGNVARNSILSSSLPESVPGTSVDRQCGSSQQAIHFAIQAVMSGTQDVVVGGGVEVMSIVPIGASIKDGYEAGHGRPFDSDGIKENYPGVFFSQFTGAELVAKKWNLSRETLDRFALSSHEKAIAATEGGYFEKEILPIAGKNAENNNEMLLHDEGIRFDASFEALSGLNPITEDGVITAGNASQITDGAAAVLVCNDAGLKKVKADPMVKVKAISVVGDDPIYMLTGHTPATHKVLEAAKMKIDEIGLYEVNEAFASVPLSFMEHFGVEHEKLNVNGGAIAMGHPLGATGAMLVGTALDELERTGKSTALTTLCVASGMGASTIIEKV